MCRTTLILKHRSEAAGAWSSYIVGLDLSKASDIGFFSNSGLFILEKKCYVMPDNCVVNR